MLISWINNFCSQRQALIFLNSEIIYLISLKYVVLPQDLCFLPILLLYFNADLVQSLINKNKSSVAFIEDYIAWVTRDFSAHNMRNLQSSVIFYWKDGADHSAEVFKLWKTVLIHSTRNKTKIQEIDKASTYIQFGHEIVEAQLCQDFGGNIRSKT